MPPYDRHIFVCVGDKCHSTDGPALYDHLKMCLKKEAADPVLRRVKRSQSKCLGMCQGGPISVVYPEGVWYCHMTPDKMDRVVSEHLRQGKPVADWVFHSLNQK